ncbi:MAG: hypothetical protein WBC73_16355, partial [Phormidesmis sp.]
MPLSVAGRCSQTQAELLSYWFFPIGSGHECVYDATLAELCEQLKEKTTVTISRSTMGRVLQQLDLTRKKKTLHATE